MVLWMTESICFSSFSFLFSRIALSVTQDVRIENGKLHVFGGEFTLQGSLQLETAELELSSESGKLIIHHPQDTDR